MHPVLDRPVRRRRIIIAIAAAALSSSLMGAEHGAAEPGGGVPVKKVVLYSSGVGYFEHAGTVNGDAVSELRFKTAQINDVLKSLVVEDAGGHIGTIAYPSLDPLAKTLRSFQVDISANPSLGDLLNQLRGAKVAVKLAGERLEGTILGVERQKRLVGDKDKGETVELWVLNLIAGATVRSVVLDDVRQLDLQDPTLQGELAKALAALANARDQDKKPVEIHFDGKGQRQVRLGYVVESPVWKASYRLLLSDAKPSIQGWAIVENQTDNDWNDVTLTLVSGRPISFVQDLYQPLYVPRPVVEPELFASLRPQTYEDGQDRDKDGRQAGEFGTHGNKQFAAKGAGRMRAAPAAAAPEMDALAGRNANALMEERADRAIDPTAGVASIANAQQVGDFFQYTVGAVTLTRQRSAMIPIVAGEISAERLSIYNQAVLDKHPLLGAKLTNSTTNHLLQGPITVLDGGSYAGDARIDNLPPGQNRLLSYAIDLEMTVDASQNQTNTLVSGSINGGVLTLKNKLSAVQDYLIANKSAKDRTVIVEHPLRSGWTLIEPAKAEESTPTLHRFRDTVKAGSQAKLTVKEEFVQFQGIAIVDSDIAQILYYAKDGAIAKPVQDALAKAATMKQAMADTQRQMNEHQNRLNAITAEQQRIRDNMARVDPKSEYSVRLLTKLNDQESQIEKLQKENDALRVSYEQQDKDLRAYLGGLRLE